MLCPSVRNASHNQYPIKGTPMSVRVKLDDIIEGLESQSDESFSFLNKKTGEIVLISDYDMRAAENNDPIEDFPEWERDQIIIAREIIAETGDYIHLPSKYDIDEYRIMEDFCWSLDDTKKGEFLHGLIGGPGTSRRFKDALYKYGIEEDWYKYHSAAIKDIAVDWCKENKIEFDET